METYISPCSMFVQLFQRGQDKAFKNETKNGIHMWGGTAKNRPRLCFEETKD